MPDERRPQARGDNPNPGIDPANPITETGGGGPGQSEAGIALIAALSLYLVLFTLFVIYCMVKIWPVPTPSRENPPVATASPSPTAAPSVTPTPGPTAATTPTPAPSQPRPGPAAAQASPTSSASPTASPSPSVEPSKITILWWQFEIWDEQRLLLLVLLGGALGTLVHSLRSVYWYIGNRELVKSWIPMYVMIPFAGGALALVFYLVIRGGFFSPQSSFQQTSPFGFTAFAALIGMFSSQAVLKLKDVAEVMLSKPLGGADNKPQGSATPATTSPAAEKPTTTPPKDGSPQPKS